MPYYDKRDSLSFEDKTLLWQGRIVIPESLRKACLRMLHEGHPGVAAMRSFARLNVWWPRIDTEIDTYVQNCRGCQENRASDPDLPLCSWTVPHEPWSRLHIDFAGPFEGYYWFVIVDATSKWLEVIPMRRITSSATINALRGVCARFGLPRVIVSDNGTQFTSAEFKAFCDLNNVKHITTPPYHPKSNGLAERHIRTFKRRFSASSSEKTTFDERLDQFLLTYRTTPHKTTERTPAEVLFGRPIKTRFTLLKPDLMQNVDAALATQKKNFDRGKKWKNFEVGETVWVTLRDAQGKKDTKKGRIVKRISRTSYRVDVEGKEVTRHVEQLRGRRE